MTPFPYNLHSHTVFCDGNNTAEEMAAAAFSLGFKTFGFSGHSIMPWYKSWTMNAYSQSQYIETVKKLKCEYEGKMEIALGLEYDSLSDYPKKMLAEFDYTIGSVHAVKLPGGEFCSVDSSVEKTLYCAEAFGGGTNFADKYYEDLIACAKRDKTDILGHFDLILKYNEAGHFIDEKSEKYRDIALSAAAEIAKTDVIVEINTGAVSRHARSIPFPTAEIIRYLNEKGVRLTLTSDTHSVETVDFYFNETLNLLRSCGVKKLTGYENGKFVEVGI